MLLQCLRVLQSRGLLFSGAGRAGASMSMIEKDIMQRSSSGKIKNHVWIEKLDLRNHLQAPPSAPEGLDLFTLAKTFVLKAIAPVLGEVNISAALGHIASGIFAGTNPAGSLGAPSSKVALDAARAMTASANAASDTMVNTATLAKDAILRAYHEGADKYVDERDNDLMLETALAEGYLDKSVERLTGAFRHKRPWVLEWCVLKKHDGLLTIFYTKKNESGFHGATKKARIRRVRFDPDAAKFCVLVAGKNGKKKKILHFRESKFKGDSEDKVLSIHAWWNEIVPQAEGLDERPAAAGWVDL